MKRYIVALRVYSEKNGDDAESEGSFEIIETGVNCHQSFFALKNPSRGFDIKKTELREYDYSYICGFIEKVIGNPDPIKAEKILKKINTLLWLKGI